MDDADGETSPSAVVLGLCLLLAVAVCSSAGVAFTALTTVNGVPPFITVCWRFWCQELIQLGPFLLELRKLNLNQRYKECHVCQESNIQGEVDGQPLNESQKECPQQKDSLITQKFIAFLPLLATSGFFLGVHFAAWVYSLRRTSLVHSMLWVSMGPILINGGNWLLFCLGIYGISEGWLRRICPKVQRPSVQETAGALTGLLGAVLMLLDIGRGSASAGSESEGSARVHEPTFAGDFAAFVGAAAVSVYLVIGRNLRSWMPVWMYAFPVVGSALATNIVFAFMYSEDRATWMGLDRTSIFGFLNGKYFFLALYLGAGPGVCGHTMLNVLLKYMSPLMISTAMLAEPILGSLIGHCFGMQPIPGMWTFLGGSILLIGLLLVVLGESESGVTDDTSEPIKIAVQDKIEQELIQQSKSDLVATSSSLRAKQQYGTMVP